MTACALNADSQLDDERETLPFIGPIAPSLSPSLEGIRILEVGGGTGSLAAYLFQQNKELFLKLEEMLLTTDYEELDRPDTLIAARMLNLKCLGSVDANAIDELRRAAVTRFARNRERPEVRRWNASAPAPFPNQG